MKLYDAHTHLNTEPLFHDWQGYLQKFIDVGGTALVNSGASELYNVQGIAIAKAAKIQFPNCLVKMTLGWHPLECVENIITLENIAEKMQRLKNFYIDHKEYIVALGETGFDLYYSNGKETYDIQKKLFIQHCEFARATGLPLVVHSRDAFYETIEVLKYYHDLTIYFHCRGYGPEEFKILHTKFKTLYIGFCGNITYKKAEKLRDTLQIVPLTQVLLETDAPYLSPQVVRGEDNHPANIRYLYDFVAEYLHIPSETLSRQIEANFFFLYKF